MTFLALPMRVAGGPVRYGEAGSTDGLGGGVRLTMETEMSLVVLQRQGRRRVEYD